MAQQEAPEVGAVIDGYRFKGGDPKQEASWEQTEPLPAPEYGQGAMRLPNGAVVRYGPRGGMDTIVSAAQAAAAGNGAESSPMVGADARARFMINLGPLQAAQDNMERMDREGYNPSSFQNTGAAALEAVPFDGGWAARRAGGEDYNAYNQAAKTFEAAILPIMSGAAVTPTEAQRLIRAALPQPGDSPEVLAQKSEQRRMMINAVAQGIGQAAPYDPNDPNNLRIRDLLPDETPEALAASGRVRGADGVWRYPRDDQGNPIFPEGGGGSPPAADSGARGVNGSARPGSGGEAAPAMGAIEARTADQGIGRRADTFVRGIADAATFGLSDEITAGLNTIAPLDRGTRGGWNGDWGGAYRQNLDLMRGIDEADAEQMPLTRGAGQLAGALAGGVVGARMAPQVLRQAPRVVGATRAADTARRAANVARLAAGGAAEGGAYGFGASEGNLLERAPDALEGAAIGGVLAPVAGVVGDAVIEPVVGGAVQAFNRTLRPHALVTQADEVAANMGNVLSDPRAQAVQTLTDNGVYLTSGQRAGGLAQTVENLAQRVPILGTAIRGARNRGRDSLNRAVGNRALDAIDEGLPANIAPGGDAVTYVSQRLGQEFDRAAAMVPEISATPELRDGVARVVAQASDLPEVQRQQLEGILESRLARLNEPMTGTQYRTIEREIDGLASQYGGSQDPAQQQMGRILEGVGGELRAHLGRVNPEAGEVLRRASDGWADFVRMRRASVASGAEPFSPGQLKTAVRTEDSSVAHGAVGRGDARMQDLSRAASTVMPDSYGNPGTADAAGWGGLGIGMLTAPVQTTGVAATLGAGALPYLAAGRNVVERLPAAASRQGDNIIRRFVARGFSEEEARGLTAAAVDPARAREVIDFLATRMNRQEARSMLRAIRFSAARGAGEYAGDEE